MPLTPEQREMYAAVYRANYQAVPRSIGLEKWRDENAAAAVAEAAITDTLARVEALLRKSGGEIRASEESIWITVPPTRGWIGYPSLAELLAAHGGEGKPKPLA